MAITAIAIALAVGGTFMQFQGQKKAAKAQKRARQAQQAQEAESTRRSRVQAMRQSQIARGRALAGAAGSGSLDTSGSAGGSASLSSQTGAGLGFSTMMSGLSDIISSQSQKAANAQANAAMGGQIAGLGFTLASNASSIQGFFDKNFGGGANKAPIPNSVIPSGGPVNSFVWPGV